MGSQFEGTVHHGGEATVAGICRNKLHTSSQEQKRWKTLKEPDVRQDCREIVSSGHERNIGLINFSLTFACTELDQIIQHSSKDWKRTQKASHLVEI